MGRYRIRCASWLRVLLRSERPFNVFALKTFLEWRGAVAEEFCQGSPDGLPLIGKPSCLDQSRQFLGKLFRQVDSNGFHGNSTFRE